MPQIIKWKSGKSISPILVSVVDINSNNGATAAGPAINFLKSYGLEVANDNANLNEQFGLSKGDLNVDDQESVYLTKGNHYFFIACNISFLNIYYHLQMNSKMKASMQWYLQMEMVYIHTNHWKIFSCMIQILEH